MTFQLVCNFIILIGAVIGAILAIIKFIKTPAIFVKKKVEDDKNKFFEDSFKRILNELNNTIATKDDLNEINNQLKELKDIDTEQSKIIELQKNNIKDMLAQRIETIYYRYRKECKIPQYMKENLDELYRDYKLAGGNHHIDKLYNRMCNWEITKELPEYDKL